ncbi:hypothetical protein A2U01_0078672, partial [Trifolium medium]|nr:hypothetical protein [Trifolium medium]
MKEVKEGEEVLGLRGSDGKEFGGRSVRGRRGTDRGRRGTEMAESESGTAVNLPA